MNARVALTLIGAWGISLFAFAAEPETHKMPPPSDRTDLTFQKDIKPIFDKACVQCHSEEKPKGKLRLDSLEATLKGGISGKSVEVGNSAKSMLVENIAFTSPEDTWMPPPGNKEKLEKLTDEEIGIVRAWIDQGAK